MIALSGVIAACQPKEKQQANEKVASTKDVVVEDCTVPASDPSASPALAVNRGDTVVVGLQEPGGVFTPHFNTSGYDGNVQSVMFLPFVDFIELVVPFIIFVEKWNV